MEGFNQLESIGFDLNIYYNSSLSNINSLNSIKTVGQILGIYGNSSLSVCSIHIVCDFLKNNENKIVLENNKEGCNSKAEALASCENLNVTNNQLYETKIYPNPTNEIINITYSNETPNKIEVYNLNGKLILTNKNINSIDLRNINSGFYILKFTFDTISAYHKIIKN